MAGLRALECRAVAASFIELGDLVCESRPGGRLQARGLPYNGPGNRNSGVLPSGYGAATAMVVVLGDVRSPAINCSATAFPAGAVSGTVICT